MRHRASVTCCWTLQWVRSRSAFGSSERRDTSSGTTARPWCATTETSGNGGGGCDGHAWSSLSAACTSRSTSACIEPPGWTWRIATRAIRAWTALHIQLLQKRHARLHHVEIQLDEVVLHAAGLGRGEDLLPVERALADGDRLLLFRRPILHVHRDEASRISGEVVRRVEPRADRGH